MSSPVPVRLLLLEDEPVSARFLHDALATLPAQVDHAATLAGASTLADAGHALWLFDARLPDGHSADLLDSLRGRGLTTPAIALTADGDDASLRRLRSAGFVLAVAKPVSAAALRSAVRRHLPDGTPVPMWDDDAAEAALGSREAVAALRRLFLDELPEQRRLIVAACRDGDHATARGLLHRMTSGCGFVGASGLLGAVRSLAAAPGDMAALAGFDACTGALCDR